VKKNISEKLAKRKRKISKRIKKRNWSNQPRPMMTGGNIRYDIDGRHKAISNGGIGNIHQLALRTGLVDEIDKRIKLLKRHLPYHESDHVLNIAYNYLAGGSRLQDIELLRNDEAWLNALGAQIIPDPTTAGDFLRRFNRENICEFLEVKTRFAVGSGGSSLHRFARKPSSTSMPPSVRPMGSIKRGWIFPMTTSGDIIHWWSHCTTHANHFM